ncbi:MAG: HDOD domain-containing protein [Phycisphaerae bacterium]
MPATIYEEIKASRELPSPTGVALQILKLAQDEDSTVEQIAAVVESDPAIVSRLLKLVNSPLAGMPRQIASIQRTVALLGVNTVTSLALGFSLVSNHRQGECSAFDHELFWSESVARGAAARHIANRVKSFSPDEAFTCGLLSQIGRLALATAFPEHYANTLRTAASDDSEELAEVEQAVFGIDHNELAAEMMGDWHMPVIFQEAVRAQGAPDKGNLEPDSRAVLFARILHLAGSIAWVLTRPTVYRDDLSTLVLEANRLRISPHIYHEVFDAIANEWREAGSIFSVRTRRVPPLAEIYSQAQERQGVLEKKGTVHAPDTLTGWKAGPTDQIGEGYSARG